MCRLIWAFAGCTYHIVGNLMHWLIIMYILNSIFTSWGISHVIFCLPSADFFKIYFFKKFFQAYHQSVPLQPVWTKIWPKQSRTITKCWTWSGSTTFYTDGVFWNNFWNNFWKKISKRLKIMQNYPAWKELKQNLWILTGFVSPQ